MMPDEAHQICADIESGKGAATLRAKYRETYPVGDIPAHAWNTNGMFILGIEYGILIALRKAFPEESA